GKQKVHPPVCAWEFKDGDAKHIDCHIDNYPADPYGHVVSKTVEFVPDRDVLRKSLLRLEFKAEIVVVDVFRFPHHRKQILCMMWAVRIFGCVGVGVMHSMKNCIGSR